MLDFKESGKTGVTGAMTRTNNKLNSHIMPSPGIKSRPHWWEASALTTVPSLLFMHNKNEFLDYFLCILFSLFLFYRMHAGLLP